MRGERARASRGTSPDRRAGGGENEDVLTHGRLDLRGGGRRRRTGIVAGVDFAGTPSYDETRARPRGRLRREADRPRGVGRGRARRRARRRARADERRAGGRGRRRRRDGARGFARRRRPSRATSTASEGAIARRARNFARRLGEASGLPVDLHGEALTSVAADAALDAAGVPSARAGGPQGCRGRRGAPERLARRARGRRVVRRRRVTRTAAIHKRHLVPLVVWVALFAILAGAVGFGLLLYARQARRTRATTATRSSCRSRRGRRRRRSSRSSRSLGVLRDWRLGMVALKVLHRGKTLKAGEYRFAGPAHARAGRPLARRGRRRDVPDHGAGGLHGRGGLLALLLAGLRGRRETTSSFSRARRSSKAFRRARRRSRASCSRTRTRSRAR